MKETTEYIKNFTSGATWYQKENADEIIKRYGGKLVEIEAPIQWN